MFVHINKIDRKLVLDQIDKGQYRDVFLNNSAKLSQFLKNKLNLNKMLGTLIEEGHKQKILDNYQYKFLSKMNNERVGVVHIEEGIKANYSVQDLIEWTNMIFDLCEKKETKK